MRASSPSRTRNARVAILVDCDGFSPEILDFALLQASTLGRVVLRRGYGNPGVLAVRWQKVMTRLAFAPCLQFQSADGASARISLTTEAMEMLFDERADVFCLVTCNAGFISLCHKLRERGASTCVIGDHRVPNALRGVCDRFFEWDNPNGILQPDEEEKSLALRNKPIPIQNTHKAAGITPSVNKAAPIKPAAVNGRENALTARAMAPQPARPTKQISLLDLASLPVKRLPKIYPEKFQPIEFYGTGSPQSIPAPNSLNYQRDNGPIGLLLPPPMGVITFNLHD